MLVPTYIMINCFKQTSNEYKPRRISWFYFIIYFFLTLFNFRNSMSMLTTKRKIAQRPLRCAILLSCSSPPEAYAQTSNMSKHADDDDGNEHLPPQTVLLKSEVWDHHPCLSKKKKKNKRKKTTKKGRKENKD